MKTSEFKAFLKNLRSCESKRPPLIESSPGVGKTQIAAQVARELDIGFMAIHAPLMQPEDYGIPVVYGENKDKIKFIVSAEKFPLESSDCGDSGIFLIDELSQADNASQKILANLIHEREIHGQKIKKGWTIVCTGNRQSDRSGANRLLGHLSDRLTRIQLDVSLDDWTQWALDNGVKTEVVAFIRFRPELLSNYDANNEKNATPRAWVDGVSARLGSISPQSEFEVFSGDVGQGAASEFLAFLKIFRTLPNPDAILLSPNDSLVPSDVATIYALVGALTNRVTEINFSNALTYIKRLPPEFSVLFVKDAIKKCPEIAASKTFIQWASKDGAELLT